MGYFDELKSQAAPPRPPAEGGAVVIPLNGTISRYAAAALRGEANEVATAPEGQRNHTLNRAWFNMGRHCAAGGIDPATVRSTLIDAARQAGLPMHEIEGVLREDTTSGLTAGAAHPRIPDPTPEAPGVTAIDMTPWPETPQARDDPEGEEEAGEAVRRRFPILDWHELWNTEDEEEEWIVEPILPARRLVALFSAPKVGKSLLMLEIAVRVAQGEFILGVRPERPRKVLYVDFENDPRGDVRTRLQAMGVRPAGLENLCYLSYPNLAKLDTWAGAAELMAIVAEYECELVVIDTISRAVAGEENENDTWLAFYRNTGLAMKQAGVACIRLDHTGKDHDKGMRGGSAKYGDVDAVWKLSKVTEDTYRLDCTDHRMRVTEETIVVKREQHPVLTHRVQAEGRQAATRAKVEEIVRVLEESDLPPSAGRPSVRDELKRRGHSASNQVVEEVIRQRKIRAGVTTLEDEE